MAVQAVHTNSLSLSAVSAAGQDKKQLLESIQTLSRQWKPTGLQRRRPTLGEPSTWDCFPHRDACGWGNQSWAGLSEGSQGKGAQDLTRRRGPAEPSWLWVRLESGTESNFKISSPFWTTVIQDRKYSHPPSRSKNKSILKGNQHHPPSSNLFHIQCQHTKHHQSGILE